MKPMVYELIIIEIPTPILRNIFYHIFNVQPKLNCKFTAVLELKPF